MGLFGYGRGGETGTGPSNLFYGLPFANYRDLGTDFSRGWVSEFVDAIGLPVDILKARFVNASARANLLDPTYVPADHGEVVTPTLATATEAPTLATSRDSMLDVLCYIAGIPTPVNTNLTVEQKQALVAAGWELLARKGTRIQIVRLASLLADGVATGWTAAPYYFAVILPDGAPSPGWGSWVSGPPETTRPWLLGVLLSHYRARLFPAWSELGVGYSQFRAGYSAVGIEPVVSVGARLCLLAGEHFSTWTAGTPDGWTAGGAGTLTQGASGGGGALNLVNHEFTGSAAQFDLSAAAAGVACSLTQATAVSINSRVTHRLQVDYHYRQGAAPFSDRLTLQIVDPTNGLYWDPDAAAWSSSVVTVVLPVSASASTRSRYACDIVPHASSTAAGTLGQSFLSVTLAATSDGTAASQLVYTLYRVGLYEKFDVDLEERAGGERTGWWPLVDGLGWATFTRGAGAGIPVEVASAGRGSYKRLTAGFYEFPYHAGLSGRGYLSTGAWQNLVKGSNDFGVDWTLTNATRAANAEVSPQVGETSPTAVRLTATATPASIRQSAIVADPSGKSYVAGLLLKKLTADTGGGSFTDVTLTLAAVGGVTSFSRAFTLTQAQGWTWLPLPATAFVGGDAGMPLRLTIAWGAASASGQVAVAQAYCYDVTGATGILYPPLVETGIGAAATMGASGLVAHISGACLHPYTLRKQLSLTGGMLALSVVPLYDANSQPSGVIFDCAEGAAKNRLRLRYVNTAGVGTVKLDLIDDGGTTHTATVTCVEGAAAAGQVPWLRDVRLDIRARWSSAFGLDLSVGSGNASQASSLPWTVSDAALSAIGLGNDYAGANPWSGWVSGYVDEDSVLVPTGVEVLNTGAI